MTINEALKKVYGKITGSDRIAFLSAFICGLLIHIPAMVKDVPNHDGLSSMYFSQNMITSGRWFLGVACAPSSYFTVPWIIGLIGIFELAVAAIFLVKILDTDNPLVIFIVSALLVSFPSLASSFAYVYTLDGYMAGLLLAVLSVYMVKKDHFVIGGILPAFSLGVYQAYLPFAMLLCIWCVWETMMQNEKGSVKKCMEYVYMGMIGAVLYYVILMVLLKVQGKVLDTYQGIDSLEHSGLSDRFSALPGLYKDFVKFTFSRGFITGDACAAGVLVLGAAAVISVVMLAVKNRLFKKAWFYWLVLLSIVLVPACANVVLMITPGVKYHLIMRYQWVLFIMAGAVLCGKFVDSREDKNKLPVLVSWASFAAAFVIVFSYAVSVNIGYTNLQRRYEKTYAYCVRLLDRIESTEGYYQGVPIAIMGVVGDDEFPPTDITGDVTSEMIGLSGDYLIYTADNYEAFMKNYLGATLTFVSPEEEEKIYYSDEYIAMESFPGETSVKMIDGVLCVKTEDAARD